MDTALNTIDNFNIIIWSVCDLCALLRSENEMKEINEMVFMVITIIQNYKHTFIYNITPVTSVHDASLHTS